MSSQNSYAGDFFRENLEAQMRLASAAKYVLKQSEPLGDIPDSLWILTGLIVSLEQDYKTAKLIGSLKTA